MWRGGGAPPADWLVALPDIVAYQRRMKEAEGQVSKPRNISVEDRQEQEQKHCEGMLKVHISIMRLNPTTRAWLNTEKEAQIERIFSRKDVKELAAFRQLVADSLTPDGSSRKAPDKTQKFDQMLVGSDQRSR